jgi:rRNA maturation RNase YbeY
MSRTLSIRNRQRVRRVNTRLMRRLTLDVLQSEMKIRSFEIVIHLVGAKEMGRLNWDFLQHEGSTDVITFDYSDSRPDDTGLHGELFICLDDAVKQAKEFRTTWQSEIVRYVIHGLLHLCGHDDVNPAARRHMKREENLILRRISEQFPASRLARAAKSPIANRKQ